MTTTSSCLADYLVVSCEGGGRSVIDGGGGSGGGGTGGRGAAGRAEENEAVAAMRRGDDDDREVSWASFMGTDVLGCWDFWGEENVSNCKAHYGKVLQTLKLLLNESF